MIKKLVKPAYVYAKNVPFWTKRWARRLKAEYTVRKGYPQIVERVKKLDQVNVLFFAYQASVWKYAELYKLLDAHPRFHVGVAVIPQIVRGEFDADGWDSATDYFKTSGYRVIQTQGNEKSEWLDVKATFNPHMVFYTTPYDYTLAQYQSTNFYDCLSGYVNYAINIVGDYEFVYNSTFHRTRWKYFVETNVHKNYAKEFSFFDKNNVVVSGYPGMDEALVKDYQAKSVWKKCETAKKRIIWAPHHSIEGPRDFKLRFGCFPSIAEELLDYFKKNNTIQLAFKPHPVLKSRLYEDPNWGKEKTDAYYAAWQDLPNGQLEEGAYLDLFSTSDAMVLDSASFMAEYLYFNKPSQFTLRDEQVDERLNSFGKGVFDCLYKARDFKDIKEFIENVVVGEKDPLATKRMHFFNTHLSNNKLASRNIYDHLLEELSIEHSA